VLKTVLRGVLALVLLSQAVLLAALLYRMWRQDQYAREMAITSPDGISRAGFINVGGIRQFVDIRGEHRSNPVLLIVTGGPGGSMVPVETLYRSWEKDFTIVEWDQRGAGKTYSESGPEHQGRMTIDQYTQDGLQVAEYARWLLRKPKIVVLGHSWGSIVALRMVKTKPELFSAYVGTGQVVAWGPQETAAYEAVLQKARAAGDASAVKTLTDLGPPPYKSLDNVMTERSLSQRYDTDAERGIFWTLAPVALTAPNYTLSDIYSYEMSQGFSAKALLGEIMAYDARKLGTDFQVPMFVLNGDHDSITPMVLSKAWFDTLKAPQKEYVVLPGGGHDALLTEPGAFHDAMLNHVWPVAHAADMVIVPPEHDQW
jgi:pimeloyl-ACP methyl ester carboxylesterase